MINEIKAKEGYVFATADKTEVYDNILVLGKYDSEDNYIQVTIEEAEILKKEIGNRITEDLLSLEINEHEDEHSFSE